MKSRFYEFIAVMVVIILGLIFRESCNDEIKYKRAITNAYITRVSLTSKPVLLRLEYIYVAKSDTQKSYSDISQYPNLTRMKKLEGRTLILIYDSTNVRSNRLLLTQHDFDRYEVWYPDSLAWLKQIIGE